MVKIYIFHFSPIKLNKIVLTHKYFKMVGDTGVEPVTSCVSCMRSNQLS